ncbi:MAG TPA: hypothetical protein VJT71_17845 [Pyrinomonadaceae bacterium]|nr:hypothetical protein [Pyrinomonadaceae bacterium]
MRIVLSAAIFIGGWLFASPERAQTPNVQQRTQEIIASLNKTKYKVATKKGVRKELYKSVQSEPVVSKNLADYAGFYEVPDLGYSLQIRIAGNGAIEASGSETEDGPTSAARRFIFKNAKIEGALLTATKVYADGSTEPFEGVFVNRTDSEGVSPTQIDRQITAFGLGVTGVRANAGFGVVLERLFYQRR